MNGNSQERKKRDKSLKNKREKITTPTKKKIPRVPRKS
jgi:hypothetical protein